MTYLAEYDRENREDPPPTDDRWFHPRWQATYEKGRENRDYIYRMWCAATGLDPESADTAFAYERAFVPMTDDPEFWRERGFA